MKKLPIKFNKLFTSFGFFTIIFASNNADLKAKYFFNSDFDSNKNFFDNQQINYYQLLSREDSFLNTQSYSNSTFNHFQENIQFIDSSKLIANNEEDLLEDDKKVLISEIKIEGWEDHPEGRKLELAAYDSMSIKPGSVVSNQMVKKDLNAIYASGWFSGVKINSEDGPLGVRLIVNVIPNPILNEVKINPEDTIVPYDFVDNVFKNNYGSTLNLNDLQKKIGLIKKWYEDKGYSLARINGPNRIYEDGVIQLKIDEGLVSSINLSFIGADEEIRKGKTKEWVIRRELKTTKGDAFNRKTLESDIKRLYATSLFNDIKVSLGPDNNNPGSIIITLAISEQRTGSLTGGLGFSNNSGVFAQLGLQETNAFGRAWSTNLNLNFGEYSTTYNFSLYDPWIKGDRYKTSLRTNIFLSRDYPQEFSSDDNGRFYGVQDFYSASGDSVASEITGSHSTVAAAKSASGGNQSWFDYEGGSIVLENIGGGFSFIRPLNGGDPFRNSSWKVQTGMNFKKVRMIDSNGHSRPFATTSASRPSTANVSDIICIGYTSSNGSCPSENTLISVLASASRNNLNNKVSPTSGNILKFGSEQFISFGNDSPTFNRTRASYAWFIPTKLIKLTKECKSDNSTSNNCPQTVGFQVKAGTIIGDLPPYESFCMGGSSSVRGWGSCDLAVSKSFVEASAEYRFPLWRMLSGSFFADAGSDLGTQEDVPGKPGKLLQKSGSGFSVGAGVGVKTPIGPLRLDIASQDLSGNMRYTLGVGWKF